LTGRKKICQSRNAQNDKAVAEEYKYPPEEAANALETVIRQCKQ